MNLAVSTRIMSFDEKKADTIPLSVSLDVSADAGYKNIDLNLCSIWNNVLFETNNSLRECIISIKDMLDKNNLIVNQASGYITTKIFDKDLSEKIIKQYVIACEMLGVKYLIVRPISKCSESGYSRSASFSETVMFYARLLDYFKEHNVKMVFENTPMNNGKMCYCNTSEEMIELVEAFSNENVGICVNTGNANTAKLNAGGFIREIGKYIKATHINDNYENEDSGNAPYDGTIDWNNVMSAFKDIDYQGDFCLDIESLTSVLPKEIQNGLINFSYELGTYLLKI